MSFNQVENAFLGAAIDSLRKQYHEMGGRDRFGLGIQTFMKIAGPDGWDYLGVAKGDEGCRIGRTLEFDPAFTPVRCYPPDPQPPDKTTAEFFEKYKGIVGQPMIGFERHIERIYESVAGSGDLPLSPATCVYAEL